MSEVLGAKRSTIAVAAFMTGLMAAGSAAGKAGTTYDSGAAAEFVGEATNRGADANTGAVVPENLRIVMDEVGAEPVTKALYDSATHYQREHGVPLPADLAEQMIHSAYSTTGDAARRYKMDSGANANNHHQEPLSLQANRALVAILGTVGEAVPWAHYAPADIGSNESKIAILHHAAGKTVGGYGANDMLDGVFAGDRYISSMRLHTVAIDGTGAASGKLTAIQDTADTCGQSGAAIKTLRGRAVLYIDGMLVGKEANSASSGANPINGMYAKGGTTYAIGGSFNADTGAFTLTSTPAIPEGVKVSVEAPIDYEQTGMPDLTPELVSRVDVYSLYAHSWRALTRVSIDSGTQVSNELSLDLFSESVMAIQNQYAIERHFDALDKARRIAANNADTFDFEWAARSQQMNRAQIWQDFGAVLGKLSQQMVENTLDHGITHLYVGKDIKSQWESLPRELFEPSGVQERPGIYRIGRLFGKYDVYYNPKAKEAANSSEILCVGRATSAARNMVVFGDSVAASVLPLAYNSDMKKGAAFFARNFSSVNPHSLSAMGAASLTVTNLR